MWRSRNGSELVLESSDGALLSFYPHTLFLLFLFQPWSSYFTCLLITSRNVHSAFPQAWCTIAMLFGFCLLCLLVVPPCLLAESGCAVLRSLCSMCSCVLLHRLTVSQLRELCSQHTFLSVSQLHCISFRWLWSPQTSAFRIVYISLVAHTVSCCKTYPYVFFMVCLIAVLKYFRNIFSLVLPTVSRTRLLV